MNYKISEVNELLNYGIINIDKPIGPTSHKTTEYVRKILGVKKAGHSGTLDPKVSGVLPIALGKATRVLEVLLALPKEYIGVMHLHEDKSFEELESARKKFLGKIKQTPPRKSAVKRVEREREVYELSFLEKKDKDILFRIKGQAGLYVRKLIHDFGNELKVGAHMIELRRISVGNFSDDNSITLYDLEKAVDDNSLQKVILPMEVAISHLARISVDQPELEKLKDGKFLLAERFGISFPDNELIAAFYRNKLISLMRLHDKKLVPDKVFVERIKEFLT